MRVNLHTHSTVSDGLLTPSELVQKLHQDGVTVFALTDHDKIDGLNEAKATSDRFAMRFINGIEISANMRNFNLSFVDSSTDSLHLLGLGFNYEKLSAIYNRRSLLKKTKLAALNITLIEQGFHIPVIKNLEKRTQLADALVFHNYAASVQEAFEKIVNPFYDRWEDSIGVEEAVEMIHSSGGLILWAHPYEALRGSSKIHLNNDQIEALCVQLKSLGIDGIEVYYQMYSPSQTEYLRSLQEKYDFVASAGTDYHGKPNQPNTFIDIDPRKIKEVLK